MLRADEFDEITQPAPMRSGSGASVERFVGYSADTAARFAAVPGGARRLLAARPSGTSEFPGSLASPKLSRK